MKEKIIEFLKTNTKILISTAIIIIVILVIIAIMKMITSRVAKKASKNKRALTIAKLVQSIIRYMVIIIGVIAIIGVWGFDITTLLAGAGIISLIIGLGAQTLVKDLLGGISIVLDNSYEVDDIIEINGFKGKVVEIGLRSTQIMNWKGELKIITNGEIKELINYSRYFSTAVVTINIDYRNDIDKVVSLLEEKLPAIKDLYQEIIEGPNVMGVSNTDTNGYEITVIAKTIPEQHYGVERSIRKFILDLLKKNNFIICHDKVEILNER